MHNDVSSTIQKVITELANPQSWKVIKGEPDLSASGIRRLENSSHEDPPNNIEHYDSSKETQHRGDFIVKNITNGNMIIVDIQLTEPTADHHKPHVNASQPANESQAIKMQKYIRNGYDIQKRPNDSVELNFFTLTTHGAPSDDAIKLVDILFKEDSSDTFKKRLFWQKLSAAIQTFRSQNIDKFKTDFFSTVSQPPLPINNHRSPRYHKNSSVLHNSSQSQISELSTSLSTLSVVRNNSGIRTRPIRH
jgi:hypothetical protein